MPQPAFILTNVSLHRGTRQILHDISASVPAGACCAILGPNGSGKSTLARILAAHIFPTRGDVIVLSAHFGESNLPALRRRIRLVQPAGPYEVDSDLTTRQAILTGFFGTLALYDKPSAAQQTKASQLLQQVGLSRTADQLYNTLSSGERVRALIARALASSPDLLLLDEPTAGLDLLAREQVLATIQSLFEAPPVGSAEASRLFPLTVVLITHHIEELPPATSHVLLLDEGHLAAAGTPAEVFQSDLLSRVYRCSLHVHHHRDRYFIHIDPASWKNLL